MKTQLSQSKLRNRLNSIKCQSKISIIDKHIKRIQNLPATMFINPQLKQHYQKAVQIQHIKQMTPLYIGSSSSINFDHFNFKKYIIYNTIIDIEHQKKQNNNYDINSYNNKIKTIFKNYKNTQCIIRIQSLIQTKIKLLIDQKLNKSYTIKGSQGILIKQEKWKNIQMTIQIMQKGVLSIVKVQIDTIKTQFKNKSTLTLVRKDHLKKQLQQYIQANKTRIPDILSKRKISSNRLHTLNSRYHYQLQSSQSSRNIRTAQSIQNRKKFIQLERSKSQFIKHLRKMSPQKQIALKQNGYKFKQAQKNQFRKLVSLIYLANFSNCVHNQKIRFYSHKIHEIKIFMLCNKFINNLKIKNKGKNTITVKGKLAVKDLTSMFTKISYQTILKRCQQRLATQMKPLFLFSTWIMMSKKVQLYQWGVKHVQKWWRGKRAQLIRKKKRRQSLQKIQKQYKKQRQIKTKIKQCQKQDLQKISSKSNVSSSNYNDEQIDQQNNIQVRY